MAQPPPRPQNARGASADRSVDPAPLGREEQVQRTRAALLDAAERLFAVDGMHAVSSRRISEAAGQGNNAAVNYHFGSRQQLVRLAIRRHAEAIDARRRAMVELIDGSTHLRDWVRCAVASVCDHVDALPQPTAYARFIAQVTADPQLRAMATEEFDSAGSSLRLLQDGLHGCVSHLPGSTRDERASMTRHLITQVIADRERALESDGPTPHVTWAAVAEGLIDAIEAVWLAPTTGPSRSTTH